MTQQEVALTLLVALAASLPGLAAFLLYKRQARSHFEMQKQLRKQLQEQINSQQQTNRFLTKRVDELEQSRAREFAETEILRQEMEDLRQVMGEFRRGLDVLTGQLKAADIPPAWSPPAVAPRNASTGANGDWGSDTSTLRRVLVERFSRDEVDDLAFQMGVESDDLSGTTKSARARALVEYLKDRGRLKELVQLIRSQRPEGDL